MISVGNSDAESAHQSRVWGYVSQPQVHRASREHITLFVHGRWVQDRGLTYAVVQAYHTFLPERRNPLAVLQIALPPEEVDVNVHPTKSEVKFRQRDAVFPYRGAGRVFRSRAKGSRPPRFDFPV